MSGCHTSAAAERVHDREEFLGRAHQAHDEPGQPVHDELRLTNGRVLDRYGAPLLDGSGMDLGWAWYFRDVTELRRAEVEQRTLAATLQASLLPPRPPKVPGMEMATRYRPGDSALLVGGDFFDVFRLGPNAWGLGVGDVWRARESGSSCQPGWWTPRDDLAPSWPAAVGTLVA